MLRKDYAVALNLQTSGPDPDPILHLFYGCGLSLNWSGYCNPAVDQLIEQQSREGDPERRKPLLWEIERKLAADDARPIIFYPKVELPEALCQGADDHGQQRLQRLANGRRLARQVAGFRQREGENVHMRRAFRDIAAIAALLLAMAAGGPALAQKQGGILRLSHFDSPASMSILEEATRATVQPMMGVFNNLVLYDQHIAQSSLATVVPDLATSAVEANMQGSAPSRCIRASNGTTASRSPATTSNAPGTC